MRVIAFDTSTQVCSVAAGDGSRWHEIEEEVGPMHSERILPLVEACLRALGWSVRDIDAIAFGAGPGSFTGLRIACGVAQGLAFGLDRPTVPVPTLAAVAHRAAAVHDARRVLVCTDARMREVYTAAYAQEGTDLKEIAAASVRAPQAVELPSADAWVGAGDGFAAYPELARRLTLAAVYADVRPTGRAVGELGLRSYATGGGVPAEAALPLYVRQRVALTTAERAAGERLAGEVRP